MDCAKGPLHAPFLAPQGQEKAFLGEALWTIDLRPRPKDRPTTLEKTDNARAGAFALNESRARRHDKTKAPILGKRAAPQGTAE